MTREPCPDEDLIAQIRGSPGASSREDLINQLFERHYSRVALWCLRLAGDRDSARDLAQDVFLKAYRGLDKYEGTSKFTTWLYVIARNHCLNAVRKRSAEAVEAEDPVVLDGHGSGEEAADHRLEREASNTLVQKLLQETLNDTERRVMRLHYAEDVPLAAISRLLQLENASGAKAYIVSAKRKLDRAVRRYRVRQQRKLSRSG